MTATPPAAAPAEARFPFEYAVLRAVPRVDRGECINVGVVLYCQARDHLAAAVRLDERRLLALDPSVDVEAVRAALDGVRAVCLGDPEAGPVAARAIRERFGWVTAPRSTVLQAGPVHGGMTADPDVELARLVHRLVD
jgi:hypothetical protein